MPSNKAGLGMSQAQEPNESGKTRKPTASSPKKKESFRDGVVAFWTLINGCPSHIGLPESAYGSSR